MSLRAPSRMPMIDALKAVASQLVVLHHLSAYGPLANSLDGRIADLLSWLYDYGRVAVQIFLVVAGFLAARSLAPQGRAAFDHLGKVIAKRYQRLAVPFVAALLFAVICSAFARTDLDDEAIPSAATLSQFLAHGLLLHGIMGVDALSAGVWYVAIDFQLFALFALLVWLGRLIGGTRLNATPFLVAALAAASLFFFNRDSNWDDWAVYFFGSYALGAAAYWASDRGRPTAWLAAIWAVGLFALLVDFRLRIAVALGTALALGISRRVGIYDRWPDIRPIEFLGRISFSVFLVHFPIYLLVNALYASQENTSEWAAATALAGAWIASIVGGQIFHRHVESRPPAYWPSQLGRISLVLVRRLSYR